MNSMNSVEHGSDSFGMTVAPHSPSELRRRSNRRNGPNDPVNHEVRAQRRLARIAGLLYLLVGIFGGFAEGFVEPKMYVAGDAAATAGNVVANAGLVRLGVVADLVDQTVFVFLALILYLLLKHVHQSAARAVVLLVALAAG